MRHLKEVYTYLGMSIVTIAIGSSISMFFGIFQSGSVAFMGSVLFFLLLGFTSHSDPNILRRMGYLVGFSGSMGLLMGPFVKPLVKNTPNIITTSFMVALLLFVFLTVFAMVSENGHWLYLRDTLLTFLSFLVYLNIGNIFFGGAFLLDQIDLYLGLPVMCGYVLYDTQWIYSEILQGNEDHVLHAMLLLIDSIGIYVRVLKIISQKKRTLRKSKKM